MIATLATGLSWLAAIGLLLATLLVSAAGASAQQTTVCSSTPGSGERIECTEDDTSTDDIDIDANGVDIDTTEDDAEGIHATHEGSGAVTIDLTGSSTVDTTGAGARAVVGNHDGTGRLEIRVSGATISTGGNLLWINNNQDVHYAYGVYGRHAGSATGDVVLDVENTTITTQGSGAAGIAGVYEVPAEEQSTATATLDIDVRNSRIETRGDTAHGILASRSGGSGGIDIDVIDTEITTSGTGGDGINVQSDIAGDVDIYLEDVDITTTSEGSQGVYIEYDADLLPARIVLEAQGGSITTQSDGIEVFVNREPGESVTVDIDVQDLGITTTGENAHGINVFNAHSGDVFIDARGGSIRTGGRAARGISGFHSGVGDLTIVTGDGHSITTTGAGASGIHGVISFGESLEITVGGSIDASGAKAHGVEVGRMSNRRVYQAAPLGDDGVRRQTVRVLGRVLGGTSVVEQGTLHDAAGVWLAGGGRVLIGPQGSVGARSGIGILATGDSLIDGETVKPGLYVEMTLNGRRVADLIGDDWIINDGGETTIVVNGVVLHDGATGTTGLRAPNGARDVWMRREGVTVDRSDPDNWVVSEASAETVADRDFSIADFINGPYGPRAAVYEAVPGLLLRLNGPADSDDRRLHAPDQSASLSFDGGTGSYGARSANVGAAFDFDRAASAAEANFQLGDRLTAWFGGLLVSGSAEVSAPTMGGTIEATGHGVSAGLAWHGEDGLHGAGSLSATLYDLSFASELRGTLKEGVGAFAHGVEIEAGRHFALGKRVELTPRAWLSRSAVSVDDFTDAVGTRVSVADAERLTGGLGALVESEFAWSGGAETFSLGGSLGFEQTFAGEETAVLVSGEELRSEAADGRTIVGMAATWRRHGFTLGGELRAHGLETDDRAHVGFVDLRMAF